MTADIKLNIMETRALDELIAGYLVEVKILNRTVEIRAFSKSVDGMAIIQVSDRK